MPLLEAKEISKRFSGIVALDRAGISVEPGEVHALVGANGAGKSTLLKIISGVIQPDSGTLMLDGREIRVSSPAHAHRLGIGLVPQEILLCEELSVTENIFLGHAGISGKGGFLRFKELDERASELLNLLQCRFSPRTIVKTLSTAQKQLVQIARSIAYHPRILALDEPTSSLSDNEVEFLFKVLHSLLSPQMAILFVSHKIKEIYSIAGSATVLTDGKLTGNVRLKETAPDTLVRMMSAGKPISAENLSAKSQPGTEVLTVNKISSRRKFQNVSFGLRAGEITGFFGLVGAGRTETVRAIFGIDSYDSGEVLMHGKKLPSDSPRASIQNGIGFLPEDRKQQGLILQMRIDHNMTLPFVEKLSAAGFVRRAEETTLCEKMTRDLSIKCAGPEQLVVQLSGGNQQKVALVRWLSNSPKALILDEPTKGVDISAKQEIHRIVRSAATGGTAVLVISSEIEEIQSLCDRAFIFRNGQIVKELSREQFSIETMMRFATLEQTEVTSHAHTRG